MDIFSHHNQPIKIWLFSHLSIEIATFLKLEELWLCSHHFGFQNSIENSIEIKNEHITALSKSIEKSIWQKLKKTDSIEKSVQSKIDFAKKINRSFDFFQSRSLWVPSFSRSKNERKHNVHRKQKLSTLWRPMASLQLQEVTHKFQH